MMMMMMKYDQQQTIGVSSDVRTPEAIIRIRHLTKFGSVRITPNRAGSDNFLLPACFSQ